MGKGDSTDRDRKKNKKNSSSDKSIYSSKHIREKEMLILNQKNNSDKNKNKKK